MNMTRVGARIRSLGPVYIASVMLIAFALAPLVWVFISSISNRIELYAAPIKHWIPEQATLDNYVELFTSGPKYRGGIALPSRDLLLSGLRNSIILSTTTAVLLTAAGLLGGYVFSRMKFRGKRTIFLLLVILVPLPIWASLTSLYFMFSQLGLLNTHLGMILLFVAYGLPLYIWLMKTYIDSGLPREIEDAAAIDGASPLRALFSVVVPIVRPGLAAVFLVAFLTTWNSFLVPVILGNSPDSQPMTVVMSFFIGQHDIEWTSMSAAAMLTIVPPLLLALFFQRYLVRGLTIGAVD
jgi:multiple sugar transport system permease protein